MPRKDFRIGTRQFTHQRPDKGFVNPNFDGSALGGKYAWCVESESRLVLAKKLTPKYFGTFSYERHLLKADMLLTANQASSYKLASQQFTVESGYILLTFEVLG